MIKIISISNHHQWDGLVLTQEQFNNLVEALNASKFYYDIKWEKVLESGGSS